MSAPLPDVFAFQNYREFLRSVVTTPGTPYHRNLRKLAVAAGMRSPASMSMIVAGKRNLSTDSAVKLSTQLSLPERRRNYFVSMVRLSQSNDQSERSSLEEQILLLKRANGKQTLELAKYRFLSRWFYPAIYVMADCPDFCANAEWIAQKLSPPISVREAREALGDLKNMGLLVEHKGKLKPRHRLIEAPNEVKSLAVRRYHETMVQLAARALDLPLEQREIQGITLSVPQSRRQEIIDKITKFRKELNETFGMSQDADRVMQLNIQFFPLSEPLAGEAK